MCVKLGQVWPLKADETVHVYLTLNKLHNFSLSGSLNSWIILQSNLYSTHSTEDKLKIQAVEVLTHLLDISDLK